MPPLTLPLRWYLGPLTQEEGNLGIPAWCHPGAVTQSLPLPNRLLASVPHQSDSNPQETAANSAESSFLERLHNEPLQLNVLQHEKNLGVCGEGGDLHRTAPLLLTLRVPIANHVAQLSGKWEEAKGWGG